MSVENIQCFNATTKKGGAISINPLLSQSFFIESPISGINIIDGANNETGQGELVFVNSPPRISWKDKNGEAGSAIEIIDKQKVIVHAASGGHLFLSINKDDFPSGQSVSTSVNVGDIERNLHDDITPLEALNGNTDYSCFYLKNTAPVSSENNNIEYNVRIWIEQQSEGDSESQIGLDPRLTGTYEAELLQSDDIAPVDVVFHNTATEESSLLIGEIPPQEHAVVWLKRSIPAANRLAHDESIGLRYSSFD